MFMSVGDMGRKHVVLAITLTLLSVFPIQVFASDSRNDTMNITSNSTNKNPTGDFHKKSEEETKCEYIPLPPKADIYYYNRNYPEGKLFSFISPPKGILPSTETKILTHGFKSNLKAPEFMQVIEAYLRYKRNVNILALDWSNYANGKYRDAALLTKPLGESLSSIYCLLQNSYDIYPQQIHFIGHNLGAHLLAFTARRASKKARRITGLDPAALCFEEECFKTQLPQLSAADASFVDILHTNAGRYGAFHCHGTADFYPNGGIHQPRCRETHDFLVLNQCDSLSAYLYFAESIANPEAFYGMFCHYPIPRAKCFASFQTSWGEHMKPFASGRYYFTTNAKPYYGRGRY